MAKIRVIARVGDTIHPRLGRLVEGEEYEIEESEFGAEIFRKKTEPQKGGSEGGTESTLRKKKKEELDG
jgi:hypothetical protein